MAASEMARGGNALTSVSAALQVQRDKKEKVFTQRLLRLCRGAAALGIIPLCQQPLPAGRPEQLPSGARTSVLVSLSVLFEATLPRRFGARIKNQNNGSRGQRFALFYPSLVGLILRPRTSVLHAGAAVFLSGGSSSLLNNSPDGVKGLLSDLLTSCSHNFGFSPTRPTAHQPQLGPPHSSFRF